MNMSVSWDMQLVLLSVLIAIIGSLTAMVQAQRMRVSNGYVAYIWMVTGGITLGMAIWSMHFIAMTAYRVPIEIRYDVNLTILSALLAISVSIFCFYAVNRPRVSIARIVLSSLPMGGGISAMHYIGMRAIAMSPPISYEPLTFSASILIAILTSMAALLILYHGNSARKPSLIRLVLGSTVMGLAISSMHYVGMLGTHIEAGSVCLNSARGFNENFPLFVFAMMSLVWFSGGIIVALVDQHIAKNKLEAMGKLEQLHFDLRKRTAELADQENMLRSITETAQDAVIMVDNSALVTYWNPAAERIFGYLKSEIIGKNLHDLITPEQYRPAAHAGFLKFTSTGRGSLVGQTRQMQAIRKNGQEFPAEISLSVVTLHHQLYAIGIVRDVTDRVSAEAQLKRIANTDTLTGIFNRRYFDEMLEMEFGRTDRFSTPFTLIMFDIDHFKRINDNFGHQSGDQVLIELANTVSASIRETDLFARWGGEEFVVLCPNSALETGHVLAEKLRKILEERHFEVVGNLTCSFGVASYIQGDDRNSLIGKVDKCLYLAKENGRNRVEIWPN